MKLNENLEKYASMLLRVGVDLQDGQELLITAAPEAAALVRKMTECAYKMGAKRVQVMWSDAVCDRLDCEYQSEEELAYVPDWRAEMVNAPARRGCAYVRILSEDPAALAGVDAKRVAIRRKALSTATKESSECRMTSKSPWLVAAYPGAEWALKVFPDDLESKAMDALYTVILQASRADGCDPAAAWAAHQKNLTQRVKWLNSQHFDRLHYKNSLGTDFTVGLAKNHVWEGGASLTPDGRSFVPNMPTEEVFTAPDRFSALVATGITAKLAIQTLMNLFVVTGIMPVTGASLPFFSYGGTALLMQLGEMGILLNISRYMRIEAKQES